MNDDQNQGPEHETRENLARAIEATISAGEQAGGDSRAVVALYERLRDEKTLKPTVLVEYRCDTKGCLLLHVWRWRGRIYGYQPAFKLSPGWVPYTGPGFTQSPAPAETQTIEARGWDLTALSANGGPTSTAIYLTCEHARVVLPLDQVTADLPKTGKRRTRRHLAGNEGLSVRLYGNKLITLPVMESRNQSD